MRKPESIEQDILDRGPDTVKNGECTACGRDFSDEPELARCPSDDCPSHWEMAGFKHPDHGEADGD